MPYQINEFCLEVSLEEEVNFLKKKSRGLYFGWYIVFAASLITLLTTGFRLGIGPFVMPIMEDLGITRTDFSMIVSISMLVYGIGMPLAGWLLKYYSTRFVLMSGVLVVSGSIVWTIMSQGIISFLSSFGILLSLGLSFISSVALTPLVNKWFIRQRGKALFYLTTGSMAGIAIMTPLETVLIKAVGWQNTLLIFMGMVICIVIPSSFFIMREDVPPGADGNREKIDPKKVQEVAPEITWKDAVSTRIYWQIVIGLFACGFSMNLLGSHAVPMLMDHNFDPTTASFGVGIIGLVAIFSTLVMGSIADRFPRKNILFVIYFVRGLGFLGLVFAVTPGQLYLVGMTGGLVWAGSTAMSSAILSDFFGVKLLGLLYGWAYFVHQIGGAIGSFLGGWGYETFGTHIISFGFAALLLMLAGVVSYRLPTRFAIAP
jgi:MFS family permease